MPTTAKLGFPGNATVYVQAYSNAAYNQVVTIQPPPNQPPPSSGTSAAVFSGNGEYNKQQSLATQGFLKLNSGGQPSFVVPEGGGEYSVSVTGGGKESQVMSDSNTLNTPAGGQILISWVSSEDSQDKDWNDSVIIFTAYLPPG